MAEHLQPSVVVVGAGIAGLAAALALAQDGLRPLLLDARGLPEWPCEGTGGVADYDRRVSSLTPRSLAFLERLGAWPLIRERRSCGYRHMHVWDAEGTAAIDFDAADLGADAIGTIVENRLLTAALAECLHRCGGIDVLAPAKLLDIERSGDALRLQLDDGREQHCDLLVAADGALSPTRQLLGFRTREWDYGHRALVTTVAFERGHGRTAWQRFLPTGPLALLPLPSAGDRLCSIVWSVDECYAEGLLALDDAAFLAALTDAAEARLGSALDCAPRVGVPLRQRHAVDYVQPGVALVADAAHTIHPLAGQGINLGLADVEVLAEEVAGARERGLAPGRADVLGRYQRRRKGDNLAMMLAMDGFKRLFEQPAPAVRWLRNEGMRRVAALPALKRQIMRHAMGLAALR